ncbi:MAG: glucuronate isomerase [Clostridiales bacterium]|nr:glucuronate isomerase [Clostridiales bacterium]
MADFLNTDFLLDSRTANALFHDYASIMPIIDYHCHIDPSEIYLNRRYNDLAEIWLGGDHYKWRLMRANGVGEDLITGCGPGWEKFKAFADVLPRAPGNPVYHWAHLELQRYFGYEKPLNPGTAREIWDYCNDRLAGDEGLRVRGIIERSKVEAIVTTDDPADSLEWHSKLASDETFKTRVLPGWRPFLAMDIESAGFPSYIEKLGDASGICIGDYSCLQEAMLRRMRFFKEHGCCSCDHGIRRIVFSPVSEAHVNEIFIRRLRGEILTNEEAEQYRYAMLTFCAKEYARLGWVMQLHLGAVRDVNTIMYDRLGPDSGFDCADSGSGLQGTAGFLNALEQDGSLPKTIIFSIDPADSQAINSLAGCFTQEGVKGKVQQGSAWWFNDTFTGIKKQITTYAETGALGCFLGMLTDSRCFLSYARHEYFRRILCSILGGWADRGLYSSDVECLGGLVQDICYNNVKKFFNF